MILFGKIGVNTGNILLRKHLTTPFIISLATSDLAFSSFTLPIMVAKFMAR